MEARSNNNELDGFVLDLQSYFQKEKVTISKEKLTTLLLNLLKKNNLKLVFWNIQYGNKKQCKP